MALPIDLSRPIRTRAGQVALVEAVRDAPKSEQETNSLEWKGSLDLAAKKDRTKIVKAVLGFANRQPDEAARAFGGCAYLLVGVEAGALAGVEPIDAAKLESALVSYVGPLIQWRPDYVEVDGKTVLVVAVEPPQAGDPIHGVRKSFSDGKAELLRDGEVFVRHQASTDPAKHGDLEALSRRAATSTAEDLDVGLRLCNEEPLARLDLDNESLDKIVNDRRGMLLQSLDGKANTLASMGVPLGTFNGDYRSEDDFRREVAKYSDALSEELPSALTARFILRDLGALHLELVNRTDRTFAGVRAELLIPEDVFVCVWQYEAKEEERNELPSSPAPFGKPSIGLGGASLISRIAIPPMPRPAWVPEREKVSGKQRVTFKDRDVRAEGTADLPPIWLIATDKTSESIAIEWEATARDASKRLTGRFEVPVSSDYVSNALLLSSAGAGEDE
jgi:hypothetical protein